MSGSQQTPGSLEAHIRVNGEEKPSSLPLECLMSAAWSSVTAPADCLWAVDRIQGRGEMGRFRKRGATASGEEAVTSPPSLGQERQRAL